MAFEVTSFKIEGIDDVIKRIGYIPSEIYQDLQVYLNDALKSILDDAKFYVPLGKTGKLRNSLRVEIENDAQKSQLYGKVVTNVPYAHLVEYGYVLTGHKPKKLLIKVMPAQSYLRTSLDANESEVLNKLLSRVKRTMEKYGSNYL